MPSRLYLPSSGAPSVSPAFEVGWIATNADRVRARRLKTGTAIATKAVPEVSLTAADVLVRQYVGPPLAVQTIAGTVKGMVRCMESATAADFRSQWSVRVVSGDGLLVRGSLLARTTSALASEWGTALAARKFPVGFTGAGATMTPITCQLGDRIVIEVGYRAHNVVNTSRTGTVEFGDPTSVGDLTETEAAQSALCSWVEFDQTLLWRFPVAVHERSGFSVSIIPDDHTGEVSAVMVAGTLPKSMTLHIDDASGTEQLTVSGPGSMPRSRTSTFHGTRLS